MLILRRIEYMYLIFKAQQTQTDNKTRSQKFSLKCLYIYKNIIHSLSVFKNT